jgi:hypothetical protein
MEQCVRNDPKDKIEFRFPCGGGVATGRFAITIFAIIRIATLVAITFIATKAGPVGAAVTWVARIRGP